MAQFQHNTHSQVMTKLTDLLGIGCIIKVKNSGEVRGVIEEIVAPVIAEDFHQSINGTQFKVRLQSGAVLTVPGSAFSNIEYAEA